MSASSGANFEASARQVARYKPKPTFGDVGNCPAAVSVATARTSRIVYFDGSQTLRIALATGSPTPCSEVSTVRRSSGASNARCVTSSTRSGGLLRSLDLARGDFHSPTARSSSFVRYPRRLACAPTSAKSQASVAASRSVCPSTYARLHRRTKARSSLGAAIAFRRQLFGLFLDTRWTTASLARRLPTGRLQTRRLPTGCRCRSVQRSLSTALHRMGPRCEFQEVPITQVQLETPTTELESDRLRSWPSIPSIAHNDHCFHGSPPVDVMPIKVRRVPRRQCLEAHLGVQASWPGYSPAWEVLTTTWTRARSHRARSSSSASRLASSSPMPGFLTGSSAMMRARSGDEQSRYVRRSSRGDGEMSIRPSSSLPTHSTFRAKRAQTTLWIRARVRCTIVGSVG